MKQTGRYYVGQTQDLEKRLEKHARGETKSVKNRGEFELVYMERCSSRAEAMKREKQIKGYKGGSAFRGLLAGRDKQNTIDTEAAMKEDKTLHVTNRDDWRAWLKKNHATQKEVWLIYYKKHTRQPRIPYGDAVEEAICFGWIDSTVKRIDDEKYAQKFTPRNDRSNWSELNRKRAEKMVKEGRMTEAGLAKFRQAGRQNANASATKPPGKRLVIPPDLKEALAANKKAEISFNNFAPGYKRLYIRWIADAKRPETRAKRIKQTVAWSAQNKKPGMM